MFYAENPTNEEQFPNVLSCLWWAVVTMTTIGYGDVYPVTVAGKVIGSIMALLGIGLVAMPTGIISAGFLEKVNERKEQKRKEAEDNAKVDREKADVEHEGHTEISDQKHYCPYCGHKLD